MEYTAAIEDLLQDALPTGCFDGIDQRCTEENSTEFICENNKVSEGVAVGLLEELEYRKTEIFRELGSSATITHKSFCQNNSEISWIESVEVSTDSGVILIERAPTSFSASFLSMTQTSFGTSSVLYACYVVNGEALEFDVIPGGIVGGFTLSDGQYDCSLFLSEAQDPSQANTTTSNQTISRTGELTDLPDNIGLAIEYFIVCVYIAISYAAAILAFLQYLSQKHSSLFKTVLNISMIAFFSVWASGNLLYTVLFSAALTESNFFYIKMGLTLTYFLTFYSFTVIVHYRQVVIIYTNRFRSLVGRITGYSEWIDVVLFSITTFVHISYLIVTLLVEYCSGPGSSINSSICYDAINSRIAQSFYQSSECHVC